MATAAAPRTPRRQKHDYSRPGPETPPPSDKKRLHGLWQDGDWWCNCEPRKKAALLEVKKDTPNKGRFFWACKAYPFCDFFLWRDDAILRETGLPSATAAAATEELPSPRPKTPSFTQRPLTSFGVLVHPARRRSEEDADAAGGERVISSPESGDDEAASPTSSSGQAKTTEATGASMGTPCPPPSKRKRDVFEGEEFSDFGSDDERQLADIADKSAERSGRHTNAFATPAASQTINTAAGLQTPSVARTLFPGTDAKRQKTVSFEEPHPLGLPTPARTPAARARTADHPATPSSSPPDITHDVTDEVMALLRGQGLDAPVLRAVHELLATSARKTRGLAMGRESTRAALKLRDDKIARLQERVAALENKEKFHGSQMTNFKAQLMKMYEDN